MTPERWRRVKEILEGAFEQRPGGRSAFLDQACAGDTELRSTAEKLLASDREMGTFLGSPAIDLAAGSQTELPSESLAGRRIGPYQLQREIGRGGMGAVYLAERADGQYRKTVAIKVVLNSHFGGADLLRRFRNERQVIAALEHPNIAQLLDGGTTDDGLPYLVMEYVAGTRIDVWCEGRTVGLADRLKLFRSVCAAVQYAHGKQVIHRDIKPANILVTDDGIPKLLDFGIAKAMDPELSAETRETTIGLGPMTPEYASPEQVRGERVGPASDIYSLGMVLYQLLAGKPPYSLERCDPGRVARIICEQEPVKPSAAVGGPGELRRELAGDLDNIVLKALRKEPGRRFSSVAEFSEDIDRYLGDQPVRSRRESTAFRARGFLRRNRPTVLTAVVSAVLAVALAFGVNRLSRPQSKDAAIRSIAILPLENLSRDPEQEPLAEGMTDALIARLSRLTSLRVISRESVMRFKGLHQPARQIAHELNLEALVEGSILRSGDRVRLSLELRAGSMDRVLWSQVYDREMRDLSTAETEASKSIVQTLTIGVTPAEDRRLSVSRNIDRQAHDAYLKGNYYVNQHTVEGFQKGLRYFNEAIDIEPAYPLAWAGLADAYYQLSSIYLPPREAMPKAKAAALKALEIEETGAEAHASMAQVQAQYEWDWQGAGKSFRRALELNPSYANAHLYYSVYLAEQGRVEDAVREAAEAKRLDPLTSNTANNLGWMYYLAGHLDQGLAEYRKILDLDPHDSTAALGAGQAYLQKGMFDQAIAELIKPQHQGTFAPSSIEQVANQTMLGYVFAVSGKPAQARQTLEGLRRLSRERVIDPFYFAVIHVGLGEADKAFEFLGKAYQERSEELLMLKVDPRLNPIRSDPRFRDLVKRIGLPP